MALPTALTSSHPSTAPQGGWAPAEVSARIGPGVRQYPAEAWTPAAPQADALGESPYWSADEQRLYWLDIPGRQALRASLQAGADGLVLAEPERWPLPQEAGCFAPVRQGGWILGMRDGIYRAAAWGGALERIVQLNYDPSTMRFNDGKCDPSGRFWAGTLFEPKTSRRAELYSVDLRDGKPWVELKAGNAITANGLAWSPEGDAVYWADTAAHAVYRWDWDGRTNTLRNHREFLRFPEKPDGWQPGQPGYLGRPDGATVDRTGHYYVAMFEGARVLKFTPRGELAAVYHLPVQCPTMPCLGGADGRTLFVTRASKGRSDDERRRMPHTGHVIALRVDEPGLPVATCDFGPARA